MKKTKRILLLTSILSLQFIDFSHAQNRFTEAAQEASRMTNQQLGITANLEMCFGYEDQDEKIVLYKMKGADNNYSILSKTDDGWVKNEGVNFESKSAGCYIFSGPGGDASDPLSFSVCPVFENFSVTHRLTIKYLDDEFDYVKFNCNE